MCAGKRPWQGLKPLLVAYQVAYRSLRPPVFELGPRCPAKLRQLIEDCWCQEPKRRPSSQQVVDRLLDILNDLPPEQVSAAAWPGVGWNGLWEESSCQYGQTGSCAGLGAGLALGPHVSLRGV